MSTSKNRKKPTIIQFRVTPEDKKRAMENANKSGKTLADYGRAVMCGGTSGIRAGKHIQINEENLSRLVIYIGLAVEEAKKRFSKFPTLTEAEETLKELRQASVKAQEILERR